MSFVAKRRLIPLSVMYFLHWHHWSVICTIFRRIRKISNSEYWLRHVCLSVRMEQLGFDCSNFHEILKLRIFRKSVIKIGQE